MILKWIGAGLILAGCGGFGFGLAAAQRREARLLAQLQQCICRMEWELQYRLTPLPQLCEQAGEQTGGDLGRFFSALAQELHSQRFPDAMSCVGLTLAMYPQLPEMVKTVLRELGCSLGRFDLTGQLQGLRYAAGICRDQLEQLRKDAPVRLRGYQTLGLCAGAALAILFV